MHEVAPRLGELLGDGAVKVCYIYRDLRDVAASAKRALGHRGEELFDYLADAVAHNQALMAHYASQSHGMLWQRYEDVYADLRGAIQDTAQFLGLPENQCAIDDVYRECSLGATSKIMDGARDQLERHVAALRKVDPKTAARFLRELRRSGGGETRVWRDPEWLMYYNHISRDKGAPGAWAKSLTAAEISAIHDRFGIWLASNGYSTSTSS